MVNHLNRMEPDLKASTLEEYQKRDKGTCISLMETVLECMVD